MAHLACPLPAPSRAHDKSSRCRFHPRGASLAPCRQATARTRGPPRTIGSTCWRAGPAGLLHTALSLRLSRAPAGWACAPAPAGAAEGDRAVASLIANQASFDVVAALADHMADLARAAGESIFVGLPDAGADVRRPGGRATRTRALRSVRLLAQVLVRRRAVGTDRLHHQSGRRQAPLPRSQRPAAAGGQAHLPGGRRDLHGILRPGRPSPACARGRPPRGSRRGHEADHPLGGAVGRGQPGAEGCGARRLRLPAVRPLQRRLDTDQGTLPEVP